MILDIVVELVACHVDAGVVGPLQQPRSSSTEVTTKEVNGHQEW